MKKLKKGEKVEKCWKNVEKMLKKGTEYVVPKQWPEKPTYQAK